MFLHTFLKVLNGKKIPMKMAGAITIRINRTVIVTVITIIIMIIVVNGIIKEINILYLIIFGLML